MYEFKESFEVLINELNNQKDINDKLFSMLENESDKLAELKFNINN